MHVYVQLLFPAKPLWEDSFYLLETAYEGQAAASEFSLGNPGLGSSGSARTMGTVLIP